MPFLRLRMSSGQFKLVTVFRGIEYTCSAAAEDHLLLDFCVKYKYEILIQMIFQQPKYSTKNNKRENNLERVIWSLRHSAP